MNIAVMLPNWIGDAVMATAALRALRAGFPRARLLGVMRPQVAELLEGTGWLDERILFSRKLRGSQGDMRALIRRLRGHRLDKFLLLTNSFSSAWIAWRSGAGQRIGFVRHARGWLLTDPLQAPRQGRRYKPRSAVDHYLEVVRAAGCPADGRRLELATVPEEEAAADRVWKRFGWHRDERVVVLNTGAAYGPAKNWPDAHFATLARQIAERLEAAVLVICGPREREAARRIAGCADHPRVRSLAEEQLGIGLSKACIRRSRLLVSTDSGPRHFAAAFDVPLITLFGPTDPRWSDNFHSAAVHLQLPIDCSPCAQRTCPLGHHRCMRDLAPERVLEAVEVQLRQAARQSA